MAEAALSNESGAEFPREATVFLYILMAWTRVVAM